MGIRCESFRPRRTASLRGFADVLLVETGLHIRDVWMRFAKYPSPNNHGMFKRNSCRHVAAQGRLVSPVHYNSVRGSARATDRGLLQDIQRTGRQLSTHLVVRMSVRLHMSSHCGTTATARREAHTRRRRRVVRCGQCATSARRCAAERA